MSISDSIAAIRAKLSDTSVDEDELSKEYIQSTFLTPSTQFSNEWLNALQEYVDPFNSYTC